MEMEFELYFVDAVFLVALTAFLTSLAHAVDGLARDKFPSLYRLGARFERRHPGLFDRGGNFYCFFNKKALYGS